LSKRDWVGFISGGSSSVVSCSSSNGSVAISVDSSSGCSLLLNSSLFAKAGFLLLSFRPFFSLFFCLPFFPSYNSRQIKSLIKLILVQRTSSIVVAKQQPRTFK
jgi:hypothetical protein